MRAGEDNLFGIIDFNPVDIQTMYNEMLMAEMLYGDFVIINNNPEYTEAWNKFKQKFLEQNPKAKLK